jgi:hypothetical protein
LRIINFLWHNYSNGKFGFSIQKQIWTDIGGRHEIYNAECPIYYFAIWGIPGAICLLLAIANLITRKRGERIINADNVGLLVGIVLSLMVIGLLKYDWFGFI